MSIVQLVQRALEERGLPEAGPGAYGYCVEDGPLWSAIVRWGRGDPFRDAHRPSILACRDALRRAGFRTIVVPFANPTGRYIQVTAPPPRRAAGE